MEAWRPTRAGVALAVFAVLLGVVAYLADNNLLYLLVATLVAVVGVDAVVGELAVRGWSVRRELPLEAFVGSPTVGMLVVSRRGLMGVGEVVFEELGADHGRAVLAEAGNEAHRLPMRWTFRGRGARTLTTVVARSSYPFGLAVRRRRVPVHDTMWVWPRPLDGAPDWANDEAPRARTDVAPHELARLRAYRPGDRLRDLHWAASARAGEPIVAEWRGETLPVCWVDVPDLQGQALEDALSRATGAVLDACAIGRPVGLRIAGRSFPPRAGHAWRRTLLLALAGAA